MEIIITNTQNTPIYEQIFNQIKAQIISGKLCADAPLPSIRSLAKDLKISVITTKRAYDELESGGYIYTISGKGSYVTPKNSQSIKEEHLKTIEEHMKQICEIADICALSAEDLIEMLKLFINER